ncbi:PepSY-associated TM helix domain-containing protein [Thioalkalivibrio sp. ALJ3]|uniref:PepSY-associated TM helix domain-containing protein n=1 Tax=Thioalkalivibrio sp. ALJ3 TaxID=1240557 RepID=UPI000364FB2C|nr:PepSY-associated TM helix domain-containing protein [Thioalkalivibrio sp. ALJ3]
MFARRSIYLAHRYLGIALGLLMAMWFTSGMVLMYVGYPSLSQDERLSGLPKLTKLDDLLSPGEVVAGHGPIDELRLNNAGGRPVYHIRDGNGRRSIDARTGDPVLMSEEILNRTVRHHLGDSVVAATLISVDQWTVPNRFDTHRPLIRAKTDDDAGTWIYVSSRTGEVVQSATRAERRWNWVGSVVHWIYPWQLRQHPEMWRQTVIWLSVPALLLVVTGVVIGIWRLRLRRRYKNNWITPYQGWQRWHHLLGITCALFVFTFMLSGLLSMNPGQIFSSANPTKELEKAWQGGKILGTTKLAGMPPGEFLDRDDDVREIEWRRHADTPLILLHTTSETRALRANGKPATFTDVRLEEHANQVLPGASVLEVKRLSERDAYYYARRNERPFPVLRITLDDADRTALYVDPEIGSIESIIDDKGRWRRWSYNALHSLDIPVLWENRPLWDITMLSLSLAGLGFSLTGVVIGWRRLNGEERTKRRPRGKDIRAKS